MLANGRQLRGILQEVCRRAGETLRLSPALVGLFLCCGYRAECHMIRALAEKLPGVADEADDPMLRMWGHAAIGSTLAVIGEFIPAREDLAWTGYGSYCCPAG